ncbi:thiamine-phosphate kinase [Holospora curviuscula]|uniref:Thiamine-monophosphate kinase n=1 Tax=Holospora curviuscula TaxID=1082868 RepID=A0A2S5RDH6_9PROT|nr:thiamine-phosphate kinase [Holospora curviuscula]PPE05357.1 Thiamine-monophosphate kinase [Holospora curviuscula]
MISEDKIIQDLKTASRGFIGDDAAILPHVNPGNRYVISKDVFIEDVHFRTSYFTSADLAHKALHVNLSDIAAMGAEPLYILCGISIPSNEQDYAIRFLDSLTAICQNIGVTLIGGDTTASLDRLFVSITALGQAPEANIKYRNASKVGDLICVIGNLGFAHLGFLGLEQSLTTSTKYINSFLRPQAKIKEGIWLGNQPVVSSMMDISDGLYIDLKRLASSSKKHAVIDMDWLQSHLTPEVSLHIALEGGEDYGLLVTVHQDSLEELSYRFTESFGYNLKIIGHITNGEGVSFTEDNKPAEIIVNHFAHFGERL